MEVALPCGAGRLPAMNPAPHSIPNHAPLKPCPFCGRPASVAAHQVAPDQKVIYSVGCFKDPDPFATALLGRLPGTAVQLHGPLGRGGQAVNRRARGAA